MATRRGGIRPLSIRPSVSIGQFDEGEEMSRLALMLIFGVAACLQAEENRPGNAAGTRNVRGDAAAPAIAAPRPIFTPQEVAAYKPKGATRCFRQLCYDYNWVGRRLADLPRKFTQADPVELAEFSRRIKLDAVLLLAVPHHGYCTYETKVGVKFPGIRGDWYGRCIQELHNRNIAVLGYITLGHNWKFMRDHFGQPPCIRPWMATASWTASSA